MGCGESKHAIATESTISQSKRSNSKKSIQENATTDDVLVPKSTQEESGNLVAEPGIGNSIVKKIGNAEKVSGDDNVKEAPKVDEILEKQVDQQSTKRDDDDVKESVDQPKGESTVENVKDGDKEEASPAAANGDGNVKEVEKVDQILEVHGDQNLKGDDVDDQPKGESVVENVKEDGDKEASPAAINEEPVVENYMREDENKQADSAADAIAVDEAKAGEEKKEVKEEISIKSNEERAEKEQEDTKLPQTDESKTDASEEKTDADEVVKEKESPKEIETEAKKDEVVKDQKEINETGKAETAQSAEAKDSTHNAVEKIPSAKEIETESAEADKKAD